MGDLRKLRDVCSEIVDCAHKTAPIDATGTHYAVGTPAMRGHRIDLAEARRISRAVFEVWTARLTPQFGDLLLAREAPVGPVVRIPKEQNIAPGQRTVLLRPKHGVADPAFLYYFLRGPAMQSALQVKASGSTVPHLNVADVRDLETPGFPVFSEQIAIAEVLGALDDKIAANERVSYASEAVVVALVESTSETTVVAELATQSTQSVQPHSFDTKVSHFSLPSFDDGGRPDLAAASSIKSNKFLIERPAVLISKLNPRITRVWDVVKLPDQVALASTEFVVLHPMDLSTTALCGALRQPAVTAALAGKVAGTSGSHQRVKPAEVLQLRVPDPRSLGPGVLQLIESVGRSIHAVREECAQLAATRDELLPLLMSGRLRVKDAEKVVAEVV